MMQIVFLGNDEMKLSSIIFIFIFALSLTSVIFAQNGGDRTKNTTSTQETKLDFIVIKVRDYETLTSIALGYAISVTELANFNRIPSNSVLKSGSKIKIPVTKEVLATLEKINYVTEKSGTLFNEGLLALQGNRRPEAGEKFDKSIEVFLYSTINVQRIQKLSDCYNQLVETIYRIEFPSGQQPPNIRSLSATCGWNVSNETADAIAKLVLTAPTERTTTTSTLISSVRNNSTNPTQGFQTQEFEPSNLDELAKLELTVEEQQVETNPIVNRNGSTIISVSKSDTWESISARTGVSVQDLRAANGNATVPGKKIIIPKGKGVNNVIYSRPTNATTTTPVRVVKAQTGDTVATLAQRYGITADEVAKFNGLLPTTKLAAGREIRIPSASSNTQNNSVSQTVNNKPKDLGANPTQARNGKVQAVIDFMNENFNDPYSVRFVRWSKVVEKTYRSISYWSVQVKFRAKNTFGAYVLSEMIFYIKNNKVVATERLY